MQNHKKEKKFISLVAYLHNEQQEIVPFFEKAVPVIKEHFEQFEIIFVDDGCTDGSVGVLKEYLEEKRISAMVNIVHMSFFHGLESAMNAGRDLAIGDFIYEFDRIHIDYDVNLLLQVYEKLLEGNDIVSAGTEKGMPLTSKVFYRMFNQTSRGQTRIGPETFRIVSRRAVNRVKSMGQYIPYRKAVYMNCGLNTARIEYASKNDRIYKKNGNSGERTSLAFDSFVYFTDVLERVSLTLCMVFLGIVVLVGIYILRDLFGDHRVAEGWISTMGFLALGFFGVFALLTIILKYLSVLLNLIFKQQRYLVSDIEKVVKE